MLYYDKIDIREGIIVAKNNVSKECIIGHYYFFNHGFKFQDSVCKSCYELTMLSLNIKNIGIITVKCVVLSCIIHGISKFEAIYLLENSVIEDSGCI